MPAAWSDFIELIGVGVLGAFDVALEVGRARRQHEDPQGSLLAGLLKLGGELAAAVDLRGSMGKGMRSINVSRNRMAAAAVGLADVPAGDDVAGGEVSADLAGHGADFQGVDLD